MNRLPEKPDLDHLKKQAKSLLAARRRGDPEAIARCRDALPVASGMTDKAVAALALRLHDAQSCIAREYGFPSWAELRSFVETRRAITADRTATILSWLRIVYAGDVAGGMNRARPAAAARMLEDNPDLVAGDPILACAIGNAAAIRAAIASDRGWIDQPGGPLALPPLVAVTHSSLIQLPAFRDALVAAAKLLLEAGADPNAAIGSRSPAGSVSEPSAATPISALYGAAGQNRDPGMTKLLLEAGADPNDGESLYHSLENPACTRLLPEAGAWVTGSNALYRVLDLDDVDTLRLLLAHGAELCADGRGQRWDRDRHRGRAAPDRGSRCRRRGSAADCRSAGAACVIPVPTGVRVWLATGYTDTRRGFPGLSLQVQEELRRDPLSGHLFCFRGRRGDLLKVIWHDGQGACLFTKKLERGRFLWPSACAMMCSAALSN